MHTRWLRLIFASTFLISIFIITSTSSPPAAAAGPWYVAPGGDDSNDCLSSSTPCETINGAIGKATSGDTIFVALGEYTTSSSSDPVVVVDKDVLLSGGWNSGFTTQDGWSVINGKDSNVGIRVAFDTSLIADHLHIDHGSRGILGLGNSSITLSQCIVSNSPFYGIIFEYSSGTEVLTINNSTLSDNHAYKSGGAINGPNTTININNSTLSGNSAEEYGGAIYLWGSSGTLSINSSTIVENEALGDDGGGLYIAGGSVSIQNSILANNNAANAGPECAGTIATSEYNLIEDPSGCTRTSSTGEVTGSDPELGLLISSPGYHPLHTGSPAIDAGNPAGCMDHLGAPLTEDQRSAVRSGVCDIGAYEYHVAGSADSIRPYAGTPQRVAPLTSLSEPLQALVLDSVGTPVSGDSVTFTAPSSGASGTFSDSGTATTSAITDEDGIAIAAVYTANDQMGTYFVDATVGGVPGSAAFEITNVAWYVAPGGDDTNDCQTPTTPCESINGALGKAGGTDQIYVSEGVYTIWWGSEVVYIDKDIKISGGWNPSFTAPTGYSTIDGELTRWGIKIDGHVNVEINHFEIQNADGDSFGGGIYSGAADLLIEDSIIHDNYTSGLGGGVGNTGGTLHIRRSAIYKNSTNGGGGIFSGNGTLIIEDSSVTNNYGSQWGGGIYASCSDVYIDNSTISENTTDSGGGGISHDCLTVLSINSSSIIGNYAQGISGGGGIFTFGGGSIQNSIISGNASDSVGMDCAGSITSLGYNIIGDSSDCTIAATTGDQFDTDPQVGPVVGQPGYNPVLAGSPAIDAGNPGGCTDHLGGTITADQRGIARSGVCDIGAYEYTVPGSAAKIYTHSGSDQHARLNETFGEVFKAVVLDSQGTPVEAVSVDFTAPASGASGTFSDTSANTTSVLTDVHGFAISPPYTANDTPGVYTVEATAAGIPTPAEFDLINVLWFVSPSGSSLNDCLTPSTPCLAISNIFLKSIFLPGDTVLLESGLYATIYTTNINQDVMLKGGWNSTFTLQDGYSTLDAGASARVVFIPSDTNVEMERFIIQNGYGNLANGAGIANLGNLIISDCQVINNTTTHFGGGIHGTNGTTSIENCIISGNTGGSGSGGIGKMGGTMDIQNSHIYGNNGGGVQGGAVTIIASVIEGNDGAGITSSGSIDIVNSVISGNTGAGIDGSNTHLYNTTVSDNGDSGILSGGGIQLENSLVAGNSGTSAPDCSGNVTSQGYNLIGDTTGCTISTAGGDLLDVDPGLGPLTGSPAHHPLLSQSPAINAGDPSGCKDHLNATINYDVRGAPRLARCDIGSFEAQSYKDVSHLSVMPGGVLTYEIGFRNWSDTSNAFALTDTLPPELTYLTGSLSATHGTPSYSAGVITWSGTVAPGQNVTIAFDAQIGDVAGEITNSAEIDNSLVIETRSATVCVDAPICSVTKYASNPVLSVGTPGSWDDDGIWHPDVLLDGSTYKMWYAGNDDTFVNHIGLATSPDGYAWTKEGSNPLLSPGTAGSWDESGVSRPSVILDGSTYKMWFTGVNSSGAIQIGYATSPDGIVWTKHPGNPVLTVGSASSWDDEDVTGPTVLKDNGTYHMWYAGNDGSAFRIGHATSSDGVTWVKDPANPVLDLGPTGAWDWLGIYSPDVVMIGDSFKMWYSGGTIPDAWQTGFAESTDGTTWTRKGMLIPEGPPGTFDTNSADHPTVLIDGASYRIWYAGIDDSDTYNIGHAEAQLCTGGAYTLYLPLVMKDYSPGPPCSPDYLDDFSDPTSGWLTYEDADVKYAYDSGEYQLWVKQPNSGWLVTPGAKATEFTAAVSARRLSGSDGAYGIVFGISDDWSSYYEVIIDNAYYSIWRWSGSWSMLKDWTFSSDIATGTAWNRLKVIREGSNISVYINDVFQTTVVDGTLTGWRRIGLLAGSPPSAPMDFRFDDFTLYTAACGPIAADAQGIEWGEAEAYEGVILPKPSPVE